MELAHSSGFSVTSHIFLMAARSTGSSAFDGFSTLNSTLDDGLKAGEVSEANEGLGAGEESGANDGLGDEAGTFKMYEAEGSGMYAGASEMYETGIGDGAGVGWHKARGEISST